jgi:hypothetical protein
MLARYGAEPTPENLKEQLRFVAKKLAHSAISFEAPKVRLVYKSISPESVQQDDFLKPLIDLMRRRGVPNKVIESLFSAGDVAPPTAGFTNVLA